MIYLQLLWSFFQIGLFSFGGGYASMRLIQNQVVTLHHWLDMTQFADIITISQMTPGPVAINSATFVGTHIAGFWGSIVATIGCVIPSCIIVIALAKIYTKYRQLDAMQAILKGLRPAVVALIASAGLSILILSLWQGGAVSWSPASVDWICAAMFVAALFILRKWKPNPIWVMVGCGVLGAIIFPFLG